MNISLSRIALLTIALFPVLTNSDAQTTLPYYTGFDNAAEKAGWVEFRKGATVAFDWTVGAATSAVSPANALYHDYPVGAGSADTTVDWYVSPGFSFPAGGKIDSFRVNVFAMAGHYGAGDSLIVYLLKGSNDPALATSKIKLADLTNMAINNNVMKDTGGFGFPPTIGIAYIAFKYQATQDWFVPTIDNIHISKNAATAIVVADQQGVMNVYPNPARKSVSIDFANGNIQDVEIQIIDLMGRTVVKKFSVAGKTTEIDVSGLAPGIYYLHGTTEGGIRFTRQLAIVP